MVVVVVDGPKEIGGREEEEAEDVGEETLDSKDAIEERFEVGLGLPRGFFHHHNNNRY